MAQFIVRNLEDEVALRIKRRAARRGRSMEEEVRRILRDSVRDELVSVPLGTRIAARFREFGFEGEIREWRGLEARAIDIAANGVPGKKATAKKTTPKSASRRRRSAPKKT